jgi:hypothetical protein
MWNIRMRLLSLCMYRAFCIVYLLFSDYLFTDLPWFILIHFRITPVRNFQILTIVYAATKLTTSIYCNCSNWYSSRSVIDYILSIVYNDHLYKHFNILILYIYKLRCFKTSDDAFCVPYSFAFDCSFACPEISFTHSCIYPIFPGSSGTTL